MPTLQKHILPSMPSIFQNGLRGYPSPINRLFHPSLQGQISPNTAATVATLNEQPSAMIVSLLNTHARSRVRILLLTNTGIGVHVYMHIR